MIIGLSEMVVTSRRSRGTERQEAFKHYSPRAHGTPNKDHIELFHLNKCGNFQINNMDKKESKIIGKQRHFNV